MKTNDKSLIYSLLIFIIVVIINYLLFNSFLPCIFHKITGFYCLGCGVTRMLISIFKLEFYQAFRYNVYLFILLIITIVYQIIKLITYKLLTKKIRLNNYIYILLLMTTIAFGILRNLPNFSYLIPTVVK